jgi:sarcosine oxidase, subunit gamma
MPGAAASLAPVRHRRRSFIYRVLDGIGAEWGEVGDAVVPLGYGRGLDAELANARRMGLVELTPLPRTGFKGAGTVDWLKGQGLEIGEPANVAYPQAGGELALKLAASEILLIDDLSASGALIGRLNGAWKWAEASPRPAMGYPVPRQESHAWFAVTGDRAPGMFAKICGVDLRPHKFENRRIAQTSAAKMGAVIVRDDMGGLPAYHVLADMASSEYLWACLLDAMAEFDGKPVGLTALRRLAGKG